MKDTYFCVFNYLFCCTCHLIREDCGGDSFGNLTPCCFCAAVCMWGEVRPVSVYTDSSMRTTGALFCSYLAEKLSLYLLGEEDRQACFHMTLKRERNVSRLWWVWPLLGWNEKHRKHSLCVVVEVGPTNTHTPLCFSPSYLSSAQERNLKMYTERNAIPLSNFRTSHSSPVTARSCMAADFNIQWDLHN